MPSTLPLVTRTRTSLTVTAITPMDSIPPALLQALQEPHRYPGDVGQVELLQTHISWVLLAGAFAYKIKKPVTLPFLDFSTLALRKKYCDDELRLNRRFSQELYLDVVAIFNTVQDPRFDGVGEPIEYAVKMRRFDQAGRLDQVCARSELRAAHLSGLADTLATFHTAAKRAPPASGYGSPDAVMAPMRDNLRDLMAARPPKGVSQQLVALQAWTESEFEKLAPLLQARQLSGCVRECHGDLHLANLVLIDDQVQMFDCIEFSDELRWIDVASEIAFVYVDLMAHRQPGLASWFVNELWERTGDYQAALALRFYAVYRALVRAKVAAIGVQATHRGAPEMVAYIALAESLTLPPPLRLVITHGLSGCGKTTASSHLLQTDAHAHTVRVRSDTERKRLFGREGTSSNGTGTVTGTDSGIYTPDDNAATYQHLFHLCEMLLCAGWSVIVDATFLMRADRESFRALARRIGAAFSILAPKATPEQLRERIVTRQRQGRDASDATLDVLAHQMKVVEPLAPEEAEANIPISR